MGKLWQIVQKHMDEQPYGVSQRRLAATLGISPTALGNWRDLKKLPEPNNLQALSNLTGTPYLRVLDAALEDAGYIPRAGESGGDTAATTPEPYGSGASNVTRLRPDEPVDPYKTDQAKVARRRKKPPTE